MDRLPSNGSYSANVALRFEWSGGIVPLGQVGPEWIIAADSARLPACEGIVIMSIDGREHRWHVRLTEGMSPEQRRTPIRDLVKLASGQQAAVA